VFTGNYRVRRGFLGPARRERVQGQPEAQAGLVRGRPYDQNLRATGVRAHGVTAESGSDEPGYARVAQLVESRAENAVVSGSSPLASTRKYRGNQSRWPEGDFALRRHTYVRRDKTVLARSHQRSGVTRYFLLSLPNPLTLPVAEDTLIKCWSRVRLSKWVPKTWGGWGDPWIAGSIGDSTFSLMG
jgi:hypothetical protein